MNGRMANSLAKKVACQFNYRGPNRIDSIDLYLNIVKKTGYNLQWNANHTKKPLMIESAS